MEYTIIIIRSPVREKCSRWGIRGFCERVRRNTRRVRASGTKRIVKRRVRNRGKRKIPRIILATCVNVKRWHTPSLREGEDGLIIYTTVQLARMR